MSTPPAFIAAKRSLSKRRVVSGVHWQQITTKSLSGRNRSRSPGPPSSAHRRRNRPGVSPADPGQVSVSGISSGAFMANQLHIAHSAGIMGAGIIAGGLYGCAVDHELEDGVYALASLAVGPCMSVPTLLQPVAFYAQLTA